MRSLSVFLALLLVLTPIASLAGSQSIGIHLDDKVDLHISLSISASPTTTQPESQPTAVAIQLQTNSENDTTQFQLGYDAGHAAMDHMQNWNWLTWSLLLAVPPILAFPVNGFFFLGISFITSILALGTLTLAVALPPPSEPPTELWDDHIPMSNEFQIGFVDGYGRKVKNQRLLVVVGGIALAVLTVSIYADATRTPPGWGHFII